MTLYIYMLALELIEPLEEAHASISLDPIVVTLIDFQLEMSRFRRTQSIFSLHDNYIQTR
jgi:hypothetical protein